MMPRALLFDLDDTILSAYARPELAWLTVADEMSERLSPLRPEELAEVIAACGREFWSDPERDRRGRRQLYEARREIVRTAFARLRAGGQLLPLAGAAEQLADRFTAYRDEQMYLFPDAQLVVDELRRRKFRLALVTNGTAQTQRAKIARFDLGLRFDHIQIEEEVGFGKPDKRVYLHAMAALGVTPAETWMIGDNLEWEVAAPQRLGIFAVWHDVAGEGLPEGTTVRPNLIIRRLRELLEHLPPQR